MMTIRWLWPWLVQRAKAWLQFTAKIPNAHGHDASSVTDSEIPLDQTDGYVEAEDPMAEDVEVAHTRRELDSAIENYMRAMYGPLVTTDWLVVAENVTDDDHRVLYPAMSDTITSWKLLGMSVAAMQHFGQVAG